MLEIWEKGGSRRAVALEAPQISLGKALSNDVVLDDPSVSGLHACVERFAAGCVIRDLGSTNGTFVNGKRVVNSVVLRSGDQIRVGETDIFFRGSDPLDSPRTDPIDPAPQVTAREHDVLVALCKPLATGDLFCEPASSGEIAATLMVSEDAVKKHLIRLYRKFLIHDAEQGRRRTRLANAALASGAVNLTDLRT
jgi:hypothetical protein